MAKDRAAPFSRKHRRYWITVTGGMLLIGAINVAIGFCSYEPPKPTERIELKLPTNDAALAVDAPGTLGIGDVPAAVLRAFALKYPQTLAAGALVEGGDYVLLFGPDAAHRRAVFRADGSFVSEQ